MTGPLDGRPAVITGASSRIGRNAAPELHAPGADGGGGGRDRCGRAWGMCIACERGVREVLTGHVSRITVALCDHFHMRRNSPRRSGGINWGSTTLPSAVPRHGGRAPHPHAHDSSPPSRGSASG